MGTPCDRKAPVKIEGMILRMVVRPAMMYAGLKLNFFNHLP